MTETTLCLLTGVPGVGKSTVGRLLAEQRPERYSYIGFGELILKALGADSSESDVTHQDLRAHVNDLVTPQVISRATDALSELLPVTTGERWFLLDSHAVSQDWFGFRVTADGPSYFSRFRYRAVLHLFAPSDVVLQRYEKSRDGRQARTRDDLELHNALQSAVSVYYGAMNGCPVYYVRADDAPHQVAESIHRLLSSLL